MVLGELVPQQSDEGPAQDEPEQQPQQGGDG